MSLRYAAILALCLSAGLVSSAASQNLAPVPPTTITTPLPQIGLEHAGECLLVYQNSTPTPTYYWTAGPTVFSLDDLHMTNTGAVELCAFDFGYYSPSGLTDAAVAFYENDGSDGVPSVLITGAVYHGLPGGINSFHVELPGGTLGPSIWMGVKLSNPSAGPLMSDPATVGSSHHMIWVEGVGLVADPVVKSDLWLAVYASPAVQVENATWGRVKAIHR